MISRRNVITTSVALFLLPLSFIPCHRDVFVKERKFLEIFKLYKFTVSGTKNFVIFIANWKGIPRRSEWSRHKWRTKTIFDMQSADRGSRGNIFPGNRGPDRKNDKTRNDATIKHSIKLVDFAGDKSSVPISQLPIKYDDWLWDWKKKEN